MRLTLRRRIALMLLLLLALFAALGAAGVLLLSRVGSSIDVILRENYESVLAMQDLKDALERIDSSCQFMLAARGLKDPAGRRALEDRARSTYQTNWQAFQSSLAREQNNITIFPAEEASVRRLEALAAAFRRQGDAFFRSAERGEIRHQDYYGKGGLYDTFAQIKDVSTEILELNQRTMKGASESALQTARWSSLGFTAGFALTGLVGVLLAWNTARAILQPVRDITESALAISGGNLDQVVPVNSDDEVGQLAQAFNVMARHLRDFRQSQSARLLRAQRTSQATIDSFPDPVLVVDPQGRVEMANPAARLLLGVVPTDGHPAASVWQPPEVLRQPLSQALQGVQNYLPDEFDRTILIGANGRERALLPRILTIHDPHGATLGAAVLLQDVTRLRLLDEMKSNLVATASHELKTPLTGIRLAVHLLLEAAPGPLTPRQTELLIDARDNCERLLAVVNNLLDLARLEQGWRQLELQPRSIAGLCEAAIDVIRPCAQDKDVDVAVQLPDNLPPVAVDAERIGHALSNLLDNALKYTESGGKVTLSAAAEKDVVVLSVIDTGPGIPPEYLPRVFEKFFRVPGQPRGGTGLGLAIVREIVTAHGGTVTCESPPGEGARFHIRLPVGPNLHRQEV